MVIMLVWFLEFILVSSEKIKDSILVYNHGSQFLGEKNQIAIKQPVHCQFFHEDHPFFKVFLKKSRWTNYF
jgi:hypothetical protein